MWEFLNAVVRGVQSGCIYAIVGLGLNIIFAATGVFNFAQGEMVMVGAMLGVTLWVSMGWPLGLALLAVVLAAAAIGGATELVAVRTTARSKEAMLWMLSTLGVAIIVRSVASNLATQHSGENASRAFPNYLHAAPWQLGKLTIVPQRAVIVPIAIALTAAIWWCFRRTLWGRGLLAMSWDREAAAMRGLPVGRLGLLAFVIGGAVAGFGGFIAGPVTQASTEMGFSLTLNAFVAATIGGIPNLWGPLLGGALLGLGQQLTATYWGADLQTPVVLGILLLVLLLRPSGILGRDVRTL